MELGKVTGSIWATQKASSLSKYKLLRVEVDDNKRKRTVIAADTLGAGVGETVIIVGGSGARTGEARASDPLDATVVAIVDESKEILLKKG